ncbi:alpha-ketoglutarate-dependent dioxygenase AlkB [Dokdonella soli]|uniref:Alpha-ketoglutarate-dependent dioxygenase AlkB n=1 Tax=Dokdonella soli TaxID=529810 RepID=A0ABN1INM4_9GAMM
MKDDSSRQRSALAFEALALPGADVRYVANAWPRAEADALFAAFRAEIPWSTHRLNLFGREVESPRLSCWIGDPDAVYTYSGTRFEPLPWTPTVAALRDDLATRLGVRFNSVLANLYRDGRDSMGWHSDDEPELGARPVIASLSFGAERTFRLRSRATRKTVLSIELAHGGLLVMAGGTQRLYQHALPKRARVEAPRINLTFRRIGEIRDVPT